MYSSFTLIKKYLRYYWKASNGKGHGIHSPFVFDFITKVLRDKKKYPLYNKIEALRKKLLLVKTAIIVEDLGAGSSVNKSSVRTIGAIAASSLKKPKYGQLLFRIVQYYKPKTIIELGTSLGVTTAYLASGNTNADVYTLEGAATVAAEASKNLRSLDVSNVEVVTGNFDDTLPDVLPGIDRIELAFIDGNHRKLPTINYFEQLLPKAAEQAVFIFDDIHWSSEMEEAWKYVQDHPAVYMTIDLFFIGLVIFNPQFKVPQHFIIRF